MTDSAESDVHQSPLIVRVGPYAGVDDLPCDGWPDEVDPSVLDRILRLLPDGWVAVPTRKRAGDESAVFVHTVRSRCRPVDTTRSRGMCPDCRHLRSGHNADGECGVCVSAEPYGGWKEKA